MIRTTDTKDPARRAARRVRALERSPGCILTLTFVALALAAAAAEACVLL
ncbi:MAG: hypothetical protein R2991_02160 [Thermoanaerobaculia bacterium]